MDECDKAFYKCLTELSIQGKPHLIADFMKVFKYLWKSQVQPLSQLNIELSKENKLLKECAEFYANTERDNVVVGNGYVVGSTIFEMGNKAEDCLEKINE